MKRWAMRLTPAAAAAPSAVRPARVWAIFIAAAIGCGGSGTSSRNACEVAREVIQGAAGRSDVDEAEQRRAQLPVAGGELHRAGVQDFERIARGRGERGRELGTDLSDGVLEVGIAWSRDSSAARVATGGVAASSASQLMS